MSLHSSLGAFVLSLSCYLFAHLVVEVYERRLVEADAHHDKRVEEDLEVDETRGDDERVVQRDTRLARQAQLLGHPVHVEEPREDVHDDLDEEQWQVYLCLYLVYAELVVGHGQGQRDEHGDEYGHHIAVGVEVVVLGSILEVDADHHREVEEEREDCE